jgi:integrase
MFEAYFKLLILTAQRRDEVAGLDWSELNRAKREWWLPRHRTKNNKEQLVPLSDLALDILDGRAGGANWPNRGLVFTTTGTSPISGFSKVKARLDLLMDQELCRDPGTSAWRAHDIRRTVATGLQRLDVRFEVTEAVLNHVSGSRSGIAGVYQRYHWAPEKHDALQRWATHLDVLTSKDDAHVRG